MLHRRLLLAGATAGILAAPALARAAGPVLRVGQQRGGVRALFEASGVARDLPYTIEWSEFPAAQPLLEALNAHAVDLGSMGDLNFFSVYASGAPIRAIGGHRSDGASQAIVVRGDSPIKTVADLAGKRVAAARGGWTHYSLLAILKNANVDFSTVKPTWLLPAEAALAFRTGNVDAWSVWEPYTSLEVMQFGARVLADAHGLTPSASLLAVHEAAIRDSRPQLADFVQRHAQARAWGRAHIQQYAQATAQLIKLPVPVLERAYQVTGDGAIRIDAALIQEFQTAVDQAALWGVIPKRIDVSAAVDSNFPPGGVV